MRALVLAAVVAMILVVPGATAGQAADTVYVGSRHSPTASGLLELIFPTAGFAYAGDWTRGFLPNAFRIAATIGFGVTADGPSEDVCEEDDACRVWAVAVIATTVWSIVGAVQTAHDHNASVRQVESRLLLEPSPAGGFSVGFRLTP